MEIDELDGCTVQPQGLVEYEQIREVIKEENISTIPLAYLLVLCRVWAAIFYAVFESIITLFSSYIFEMFVFILNISHFPSLHVLFLRL